MFKKSWIFLLLFVIAPMVTTSKKGQNVKIYDFDGFDSLCMVDSIPRNLREWQDQDYYDDVNDRVKTRYNILKNDSIFYVVELSDDGDFIVEKKKITE